MIPAPLAQRLPSTLAAQGVAVLLASWVLAASSWVSVPLWPVPMTMQTFAVLLVGALMGWRLGALAVVAFLAQGAAGLPVFAGGAAGPQVLIGPTGGYLVGFIAAAALAGLAVERGLGRRALTLFPALLVAHLVVFVPGVAQLALFIGWPEAFASGFVVFILGTLAKTGLATAAIRAAIR